MSNPAGQSCSRCQCFIRANPNDESENAVGVCRRHPPRVFIIPMQQMQPSSLLKPGQPPQMTIQPTAQSFFPNVMASGWCGEFILSKAYH